MKRLPSILPRTAVVLVTSLGVGAAAGYVLARGGSHHSHRGEIRRAARAANVNTKLLCAIADASGDGRMGVKARAEELAGHYSIRARELYAHGERLNWMPELAVAAFVTEGRFVPFALANSHLPEDELALSAPPEELRRSVRACLRRWAELEGRAPLRGPERFRSTGCTGPPPPTPPRPPPRSR